MVPLLPLRDGVRALPISFFRQSMPSFYMNAPDCICSPGRLPLGAFCTGRDDQAVAFRLARSAISIHAPRVGRDAGWAIRCIHYSISIHAPRAGCDHMAAAFSSVCAAFQSTHPVRGATLFAPSLTAFSGFQSTHPVRGATYKPCSCPIWIEISIHAPRAGCDLDIHNHLKEQDEFQSTHPVRGATNVSTGSADGSGISIHAPRAGCDELFHPTGDYSGQFQSTHPVRGATRAGLDWYWSKYFNPRTPCGVRLLLYLSNMSSLNFNPRTPCGVRLQGHYGAQGACDFNPRTPCGVRRSCHTHLLPHRSNFNPRTPCGVRPHGPHPMSTSKDFNPRTPCGVRLHTMK